MHVEVRNIFTRITDASPKSVKKLKSHLRVYAPGYQYTKQFKRKHWDGKVHIFDGENFPTGMLPYVIELVDEPVVVDDLRGAVAHVLHPPRVNLRDYQWDAVTACMSNIVANTWWPRGVIKVATGGGKTEIAAAMIQMVNKPTLFIVNTKDLLWQSHDRFKKYGIDVGVVGDGKFKPKHTTVCTIQTLARITDKSKRQFIKDAKQVFFDEAHLLAADLKKGNVFISTANMMWNAYMRWGLTATPFMKDNYSNFLLEGATGPVLYEVSNRELIDRGFLSDAKVKMYEIPTDKHITEKWPDAYDEGVVTYRKRNNKIVELIGNSASPMLILVQREGHGNLLSQLCSDAGLNVPFVFGQHKSKERKRLASDLMNGRVKAVIASTIWDQGVDLPNIRTLILAGGGKSLVRNLQRLGRGLRLSTGKSHVEIIDFYDYSTRWLRDHSKQRKSLWEEQGFQVDMEPL